MVNPQKVKQKLPNLLVDGLTSNPVALMQVLQKEYRLDKYARKEPLKFQADLAQVIGSLERISLNADQFYFNSKPRRK